MNIIMYEMKKANLNAARDISGYVDNFNPNEIKISEYKLIFILPNGKCLFMPYAPKDTGKRDQQKYFHIAYITKAVDLIIKELGLNIKDFINQKVKEFDQDEITAAILSLGIPFFYETGYYDSDGNSIDGENRYTIFEKTIKFTEKQEKTLLAFKELLKRENYNISIQVVSTDETLINRKKCIGATDDSPLSWIYYYGSRRTKFGF